MVSLSEELIDFITGNGKRRLFVLRAFFDESGTHWDSPVLCVAGYIGERDQWVEFDSKWEKTLSEFGIECFHAKEQKCDPLRPHLVELINESRLDGIVASVNRTHYKTNSNDHLRTVMSDAYGFCAFSCGIGFAEWAKEKGRGPVALVYEHGRPNAAFIKNILDAMMNFDDSIASTTIARKKQLLPLQAADFLANSYANPDPFWFGELAAGGQVTHRYITPEIIGGLANEVSRLFAEEKREQKRMKRLQKMGIKNHDGQKEKTTTR